MVFLTFLADNALIPAPQTHVSAAESGSRAESPCLNFVINLSFKEEFYMYDKVPTNLNFVEREVQVEKYWKDNDIFGKSIGQSPEVFQSSGLSAIKNPFAITGRTGSRYHLI